MPGSRGGGSRINRLGETVGVAASVVVAEKQGEERRTAEDDAMWRVVVQ